LRHFTFQVDGTGRISNFLEDINLILRIEEYL
jgi:hypothetical protein